MSSKRKTSASGTRGTMSARTWADIRQGARLANAQGVKLIMHGVEIIPLDKRVRKGAKSSQPRATATTNTTTERDGRAPPVALPGDACDKPTKRQQRSAQRFQDHRKKQRAAIVHARWLSIMHRKRMHAVWTAYMRSTLALRKLRGLLWKAWNMKCIDFKEYFSSPQGSVMSPISHRDVYIYLKVKRLAVRVPNFEDTGLISTRHPLDWLRRPSTFGPHWLHASRGQVGCVDADEASDADDAHDYEDEEMQLALERSMQQFNINDRGANCAVNRQPSTPKGGGKKPRDGRSSRSSTKKRR